MASGGGRTLDLTFPNARLGLTGSHFARSTVYMGKTRSSKRKRRSSSGGVSNKGSTGGVTAEARKTDMASASPLVSDLKVIIEESIEAALSRQLQHVAKSAEVQAIRDELGQVLRRQDELEYRLDNLEKKVADVEKTPSHPKIKLGIELQPSCIDRAHRVGDKNGNSARFMLIKLKGKKDDTGRPLLIVADLTKENHRVFAAAMNAKKGNLIKDTWVDRNCRIMITLLDNNTKCIQSIDDLPSG
ncbi:hypothetical protein Bbelb_291540 [Branchiostoma belcheri]|nr:hypothetical protein Bbelb_291540 [Branchiostoma belcheri]